MRKTKNNKDRIEEEDGPGCFRCPSWVSARYASWERRRNRVYYCYRRSSRFGINARHVHEKHVHAINMYYGFFRRRGKCYCESHEYNFYVHKMLIRGRL
jgi:hypothetical protein